MKNNAVICPPCGENVGLPTKRGAYKGFTLIELLVVVLIIGILVAVAVPQYQVAVAKSRYAKLKHLVKALANAQEVYYLANGQYSIRMENLDINLSQPSDESKIDSQDTYIYDWGECFITLQMVGCLDTKSKIRYLIWLEHTSAQYVGKQMCQAYDPSDVLAHKICKQDSGLLVPSNNINWYVW